MNHEEFIRHHEEWLTKNLFDERVYQTCRALLVRQSNESQEMQQRRLIEFLEADDNFGA